MAEPSQRGRRQGYQQQPPPFLSSSSLLPSSARPQEREGAWTTAYEDVADITYSSERDRMLPSTPSTPTGASSPSSPSPTASSFPQSASHPARLRNAAQQAAGGMTSSSSAPMMSTPSASGSASTASMAAHHRAASPANHQGTHLYDSATSQHEGSPQVSSSSSNTLTQPQPGFSRASRNSSYKNFPGSPLNPSSPLAGSTSSPPVAFSPQGSHFARPASRTSLISANNVNAPPTFSRMATEELRALSSSPHSHLHPSAPTAPGISSLVPAGSAGGLGPYPTVGGSSAAGNRGSMILYRRADSFVGTPVLVQGEDGSRMDFLPPPIVVNPDGTLSNSGGLGGGYGSNRGSMYSVSGDSIASMAYPGFASESKYPPSLFAPGTPTGSPAHLRPMSAYDGPPNRASVFSGLGADNRASVYSTMTYSGGGVGGGRGLVAYAYDPDEDDDSEDDEDDWLHDPDVDYPKYLPTPGNGGVKRKGTVRSEGSGVPVNGGSDGTSESGAYSTDLKSGVDTATKPVRTSNSHNTPGKQVDPAKPSKPVKRKDRTPPGISSFSWRGLVNITTLLAMIAALLCLFVVYPVIRVGMDEGVNARITGNTRINATGQAEEDTGGGGEDLSSVSRSRSVLNPIGVTFDRRALYTLPVEMPAILTSVAPSPTSTAHATEKTVGGSWRVEKGVKPAPEGVLEGWWPAASQVPMSRPEAEVEAPKKQHGTSGVERLCVVGRDWVRVDDKFVTLVDPSTNLWDISDSAPDVDAPVKNTGRKAIMIIRGPSSSKSGSACHEEEDFGPGIERMHFEQVTSSRISGGRPFKGVWRSESCDGSEGKAVLRLDLVN